MNLSVLPHRLAVASSATAFAIVWTAGLVCRVPVHAVSLRAILGAAAFWALGYIGGRLFVNAVYDAMAESLRKEKSEAAPAAKPGPARSTGGRQ